MEVYVLFGQYEDPYLVENLLGVYHTKEDAEFHYNEYLTNGDKNGLKKYFNDFYTDYSIKKVIIGARAKDDHMEV